MDEEGLARFVREQEIGLVGTGHGCPYGCEFCTVTRFFSSGA
jgi:radical SAM superfamily enzyme YgiQ (UPF0313 family)